MHIGERAIGWLAGKANLEDHCLLDGRKRHELDEDNDLSPFNMPLFKLGLVLEKKWKKMSHLRATPLFSFMNGKVLSLNFHLELCLYHIW